MSAGVLEVGSRMRMDWSAAEIKNCEVILKRTITIDRDKGGYDGCRRSNTTGNAGV